MEIKIKVGTSFDDAQRELLVATLICTNWDRRKAAKILKCCYKTVYNLSHKYGLFHRHYKRSAASESRSAS